MTSKGQTSWKGLDKIPKEWITVERDSLGYLIYTPCNGMTPRISIDKGYVIIYWQLDSPSKLAINKFTRLTGNRSFYINAGVGEEVFEFTAVLKDDKQTLALWTFGDFKWVMTPYNNQKHFRQIDNPCPTQKKPEKQFLPVEF